MLLVFALGDPHLVEGAETAEDAASDPAGEAPLAGVAGGGHAHTWAGKESGEFLVESLGEAVEKGGSARDDDVVEEMGTHVDVHGGDCRCDQRWNCLAG